MAFAQLHWPSRLLGRHTTTWVLLPDAGTPPFATLYLLHGLSDDHTIWLRRTRIESYVAGLPLIVVMPDGGRGFYTDHPDGGPPWATHVAVELPTMIERTFPAKPTRDGRHIGGLSMGGYGALRAALANPDRFASAHSHSGAVLGPSRPGILSVAEHRAIVGPGATWAGTENDLALLAARAAGPRPRLHLDCGVGDFLLEDNRAFHRQLAVDGVDHEYAEHPGEHSWDYWDARVREAIDFHLAGSTKSETRNPK